MISPAGLIVPSTLEIAVKATSLVRSREQRIERVQAEQAVVGQGNVPQHGPAALGKLLPGDEIRVMLHLGEQDLVARLDVRIAPAPRHGIDARGRPVGENALLALGGIDERADRFPGLVEQLVRLLGQLVNAAMHVGIVLFVATDDRLDDLAGMLRAGRVVEIDQRHARADLAAEDGEIGSGRPRGPAAGFARACS